jgi:hypothetical protein
VQAPYMYCAPFWNTKDMRRVITTAATKPAMIARVYLPIARPRTDPKCHAAYGLQA